MPDFVKLNTMWDACPGSPEPECSVSGSTLTLRFLLGPWTNQSKHDEWATLTFSDCGRWRLGPTNDEGWYLGQCRYSRVAPSWGEFYEITGPDERRDEPTDWISLGGKGDRHFLFYFKDETFECLASGWRYEGASMTPAQITRRRNWPN